MTDLATIFTIVTVTAGLLFMFVGSLGVVRLPDFYSRTHAASKADTLGILLVILGLMIHHGMTLESLKLLFILIFVAVANPIGSHALARAAFHSGIKPFFNPGRSGERGARDLET